MYLIDLYGQKFYQREGLEIAIDYVNLKYKIYQQIRPKVSLLSLLIHAIESPQI